MCSFDQSQFQAKLPQLRDGVLGFLKENAPFRSGILPFFLLGSDPWDIGDIMSTPPKKNLLSVLETSKFM